MWSSVAPSNSMTRDLYLGPTCMWAETYRFQSDSEGFSPCTLVFLPLQIRLLRHHDLTRKAIKHKPLARKNRQPLPSQLTLNKISYYLGFYPAVFLSACFHFQLKCKRDNESLTIKKFKNTILPLLNGIF